VRAVEVRETRTGRMKVSTKVATLLKAISVGAFGVLMLGFSVESSVLMPGYAAVYIDPIAHTYIALPCIEEWRTRSGSTIEIVTLGTADEARRMHYKMDEDCRNAGAFVDDDRSLSGLLLVKIGVLPPLQHWWDRPFRTEDGVAHFPQSN
jgi:hypothetical protein